MSTVKCTECGAGATIARSDYHYVESGLDNVILHNVQVVKCPNCKETGVIFHRIDDIHRDIARAIIDQPYRMTGKELRFLRRYLEMTGDQLSSMLKVDRTTLSKWETGGDPIGHQSDRLIRLIAVALGRDLGRGLREAVERFPDIQEKAKKGVMIEISAAA